jgi:hypothetical protein
MQEFMAILVGVLLVSGVSNIVLFFALFNREQELEDARKEINKQDIEYYNLSEKASVNELGITIAKDKVKEITTKLVVEKAKTVELESRVDDLKYEIHLLNLDMYEESKSITFGVYYDTVNDSIVEFRNLERIGDL